MAQYIYILINPSLGGLLKIGRTSRSPEQRAAELSNGTNMPTPFVVAYEEEVPDSHIAEKLVHEELKQRGLRINDSREFFSIPLKIAIQVVSQIAQQLRESISSNSESLSDEVTNEETTAEYYLLQGLNAMNGSENTLQDYFVAREFFERAIDLGSVQAYSFLAYLYICGNGVRKSHEAALKILKSGGEKGDPECFKTMWDIYAGKTVLDVRHDGNAELCFQWFLDASKGDVKFTALSDYLAHSYEKLGGDVFTWGEKRFPMSQFPGKFVSVVIDIWIDRIQQAFRQIRDGRLAGLLIDQVEATSDPAAPSILDVIQFQYFVSECVQDSHSLMKRAMAGVEKEDLEYCFSRAQDVKQTINEYMPYISISSCTEDQEIQTPVLTTASTGFFGRLFSRK